MFFSLLKILNLSLVIYPLSPTKLILISSLILKGILFMILLTCLDSCSWYLFIKFLLFILSSKTETHNGILFSSHIIAIGVMFFFLYSTFLYTYSLP
jgi:hypothetical protein